MLKGGVISMCTQSRFLKDVGANLSLAHFYNSGCGQRRTGPYCRSSRGLRCHGVLSITPMPCRESIGFKRSTLLLPTLQALERVPSDIRKMGGVARMSDPQMIKEIMEAVSIPVRLKAIFFLSLRSVF